MIAANLFDALGVAPALPGARCRGHHALHDPAEPGEDPTVVAQRHAQALELCSGCQSLGRCREWLDGLKPSKRPLGVVAGLINEPSRPGRPRKAGCWDHAQPLGSASFAASTPQGQTPASATAVDPPRP